MCSVVGYSHVEVSTRTGILRDCRLVLRILVTAGIAVVAVASLTR